MKHKTDHLFELFSKQRVQEIKTAAINYVQLGPSRNVILGDENISNVNNTSIANHVSPISTSCQTEHVPINKSESIRDVKFSNYPLCKKGLLNAVDFGKIDVLSTTQKRALPA